MSARQTVLLLGAGGHARACVDLIEQHGGYTIAGLVGLEAEVGSTVLGYPVLGTDAQLPELLGRYGAGLVTMGQIKSAAPRVRLFEQLTRHAATRPAIVSPRAYVSPHATLGQGTVVLPGAAVIAGATVGRNCIINSMALVEHDAVVGDHCHVATGARLNSAVHVGDRTFIGSGSVIRQGIRIGCDCVLGMGTMLTHDCGDGMLFRQPTRDPSCAH
jgi:sugar O-acyltransferase (sialic acid O-acetyltransferase NeuD family)